MAKIICPHCGAFTAFSPARVVGKGILLDSSSETKTVYGDVDISAIVPHELTYGEYAYAILVCRACDEFFIAQKERYSSEPPEWSAVYPIQHKTVPEEIPEPSKSEFEEANLCYAIEAYRACVSMCQITLETLWRQQKASGVNQLKDRGVISTQLHRRANEIRLWGNIAKHELIADPVSKEDAKQLLGYLEILLNEVYVEPKRLDDLAEKREELEEKG